MPLITKDQERKLIEMHNLYSDGSEPIENRLAIVRLFFPGTTCVWYLLEYDHETGLFFGRADMTGETGELGYSSREELETLEVMGMRVIRDDMFRPQLLKDCPDVYLYI